MFSVNLSFNMFKIELENDVLYIQSDIVYQLLQEKAWFQWWNAFFELQANVFVIPCFQLSYLLSLYLFPDEVLSNKIMIRYSYQKLLFQYLPESEYGHAYV